MRLSTANCVASVQVLFAATTMVSDTSVQSAADVMRASNGGAVPLAEMRLNVPATFELVGLSEVSIVGSVLPPHAATREASSRQYGARMRTTSRSRGRRGMREGRLEP